MNEKIEKARGKTWFQLVLFTLLSMVTTVVDLGTFALFNYLVFTAYRNIPFQWWLLDYSVPNGGFTAFLSFALSFAISQTFNFFIQRKVTFRAKNNLLLSGTLYAIMVLIVFSLQLWMPTVLRAPLSGLVGVGWADFIVKNVNMTISFLIQFPVSKYIIMRVGNRQVSDSNHVI